MAGKKRTGSRFTRTGTASPRASFKTRIWPPLRISRAFDQGEPRLLRPCYRTIEKAAFESIYNQKRELSFSDLQEIFNKIKAGEMDFGRFCDSLKGAQNLV